MSTENLTSRRFEGKVAIITASSIGIGYGIAERLGREGAVVFVSSRKRHLVDAAVEKLKVMGVKAHGCTCHVAVEEDRVALFQMAVDLYGGFDILVSNAAINPIFGNIFETPEDSWDKIFEVNVKSTFLLCKEAMPIFKERGGGKIVLVSSIAAYTYPEVIGAYATSKTAVVGMMKAMVPECARHNVTINAIAPGIIKTKFTSVVWETEEIEKKTSSGVPFKRLGRSEDCSGVVAFLLSEDALYISGETIVIGGGSMSRL